MWGELSTTFELSKVELSKVNYQSELLLSKVKSELSTEVTQWGTPSCNRPQPTTNYGVRDGRYN